MKKIIAFLFLFQLSFGQNDPESTEVEYKDSIVETLKFDIGNVDNDKSKDFAIAIFSKDKHGQILHNAISVKFSNCSKTDLGFYPSEAIFIAKTEDVNGDGCNEIIIFSKTLEGWWNDISVWTYKNKEWKEVAKTKGFCSLDEDFENRVVKIKNKYFLNGEIWDFEIGDIKKIKIKLN